MFHYAEHGDNYGLKIQKPDFDIAAVVKRSRGVSAQLNGGVAGLMKKNKIDVIWGQAKLTKAGKGGPVEVEVGEPTKPAVQPQNPVPKGVLGHGTYKAKHVIVATGAAPARPAGHRGRRRAHLDLFRGDEAAGRCRNP